MLRSLPAAAVTTAAATAALALFAGPAAAAPPSKVARFKASLTLTQTTTYDEPKHFTGQGDCYFKGWTQADQKETWTVRATPKVIAIHRGPAGTAFVDYGGRTDALATLGLGLPAQTTRTRESFRQDGADPGPCGSRAGEELDVPPLVLPDCGALRFRSLAMIDLRGGEVVPRVVKNPNDPAKDDFRNCELHRPQGTVELINDAPERLPLSDLMDPELGLHVVQGSKTYRSKTEHSTAKTTVKWQLRLQRLGK